MKKLILTIFTLCLLVPTFIGAQSFSKAEKKVISAVNDYWALWEGDNKEAYLNTFHKSYKGWDINDGFVSNKEALVKQVDYRWGKNESLFREITPVGVVLHDDIAIVHYYYILVVKNKETSKTTTWNGRWTDILINDGGKWKLIADHGGNKE